MVCTGFQPSFPADLAILIGTEAGIVTLAGLAVGLTGALGVSTLVRAFMFGVSPLDPRILATAGVALIFVTALATLLPALRAASTDPLVALRSD